MSCLWCSVLQCVGNACSQARRLRSQRMPLWDECGLAASLSVTRSSLAFVVHMTSCMPWVQLQVQFNDRSR